MHRLKINGNSCEPVWNIHWKKVCNEGRKQYGKVIHHHYKGKGKRCLLRGSSINCLIVNQRLDDAIAQTY